MQKQSGSSIHPDGKTNMQLVDQTSSNPVERGLTGSGAKKKDKWKKPKSVLDLARTLAADLSDREQKAEEVTSSKTLTVSTTAFDDPRVTPDRRSRNTIFFAGFRDRRVHNRRHTCSVNGNWWMLRDYSSHL